MLYYYRPEHFDGLGSQFMRHVTALAFSYKFGCTYLPLPLTQIQHLSVDQTKLIGQITNIKSMKYDSNLLRVPSRFWLDPWVPPSTARIIIDEIINLVNNGKMQKAVMSVHGQYHQVNISDPSDFNLYFAKSIEVFRKEIESHFSLETIKNQISIHVRRGDLLLPEWTKHRSSVSTEKCLDMINILSKKYKEYEINVFTEISDLNPSEFDFLHSVPNVRVRANEDAISNWIEMMRSEVLVMDKSTFSSSAAYLNCNKVYYWDRHITLPSVYNNWEKI